MWFEHFWTQCRLCKLNIKGAWGFWSHLAQTSQEGLIPWMPDCTSEHQQGSAEGLRLSWHHTWAVCHGFHVTVLGETCSGTVGHPWRAVGHRELGPCTPLPLMGSIDEVSGSGWLGSQGLRLSVYISCYYLPLPLSYFALHPFSLETNHHPERKARLFAHKVWGEPCVTPHLSCKELLFLVLHCALWGCLLPK